MIGRRHLAGLGLGVALALGACAGESEEPAAPDGSTVPAGAADATGSLRPSSTDGDAPTTTAPVSADVAALFDAFGSTVVRLTTAAGEALALCMIHADLPDERGQGLMGVTDLSGADGMLFENEEERDGRFFMFQTLVPLTVGWWDDDGAYVGQADMVPCGSDDAAECLRYPAPGPFRFAVEVGVDDPLGDRFPGSTIAVTGDSCHTS